MNNSYKGQPLQTHGYKLESGEMKISEIRMI